MNVVLTREILLQLLYPSFQTDIWQPLGDVQNVMKIIWKTETMYFSCLCLHIPKSVDLQPTATTFYMRSKDTNTVFWFHAVGLCVAVNDQCLGSQPVWRVKVPLR